MTVLELVMVAALAGEHPRSQLDALARHLESHPAAAAQDVYKFLHQGVFGPGHVVRDRDAAGRFLKREIDGLDLSMAIETPCEPLSGDPAMVRVHLRPFVRSGFDAGALLEALVASATATQGDLAIMRAALDAAIEWLRESGRRGTADDLERLRDGLEAGGFPPMHHSEAYREAYHPAYRVVTERTARERGWCDTTDQS